MSVRRWFLSLLACSAMSTAVSAQPARIVEFNRDVRPILSDACFNCHGPDKSKRKADLHFDTEEGARADLGDHFAIVPGKPEQSALVQRVANGDPRKRMPPPSAGPALTKEQIETLRLWIAQGATWQKHWSFIPPTRPPLPAIKYKSWPKNPIDDHVLARLEKEGLKPAPEADPVTLIRRVTLDLTGLPPTPKEVDEFVRAYGSNKSNRAYVDLVDRLLASPRYGERMAQRWLDAARYADTNGYQTDGDRTMWRWRDWVIDAFNANMPFDQFTIEQLAGDMLPKPTLEQKIATGFNRNHRGNSEGGVIPEEYAVEYVVDRIDTTATVWLGLTAGCAKCHNHKYDPVSQKEFYQLFAYFNNVPEKGKAIKYGNSPPYIKAPTREQAAKLEEMRAQLQSAEVEWQKLQPELAKLQAAWEKEALPIVTFGTVVPGFPGCNPDWTLDRGLQAAFLIRHRSVGGGRKGGGGDFIVPAQGKGPRVIDPNQESLPTTFPAEDAMPIAAEQIGNFGFFDKFSIAAWIGPKEQGGPIVTKMNDADRAEGYGVWVQDGKIAVHLVKRWLDDAIRLETVTKLEPSKWHHVLMTYDGSRLASGVKVYINGQRATLNVLLDDLNQSFATKEPVRIGHGGGQHFHGAINDLRIYDRVLTVQEAAIVANWNTIQELIQTPIAKRTPAQKDKLRAYFLDKHPANRPVKEGEIRFTFLYPEVPQNVRDARDRLMKAQSQFEKFDESIPTTMVMEEMPTPRATHILLRGEYDKPGSRVFPGVPQAFGEFPKGLPNNRLGLAQWLVRRDNPLTARVAVNRFWQMLFGTGIVKSVEDFGAQGEWPTHPELLDWLAVEFMEPSVDCCENPESGNRNPELRPWDIKQLLKTIVTSATYRQSSKTSKELLQRDPDNRLLARGPRFRLSADMIRDQALFASGLLVEKLGGPSVKPYSPPGLIKELHGTDEDAQDHGSSLYRRSLYTYWKRTVAPPALMTFDAANRETCVVRETRTNTPLQALNLLNDVTYVEAARVLAQRVMKEAGPSAADRVSLAFRLTTSRLPQPRELEILELGLAQHQKHYRQNADAALKFISRGEAPRDSKLDVAELAAYTALCNTLLNLDEVITKE